MKSTLSKGEIADLLRISKSQVRFYEQKGLLDPSKEENGYASYDYEDLDKLEMILLFKELGMSIKEMKDVMKNETFDYEFYLNKSLVRVEKEIEASKRKRQMILQRLKQYNKDQATLFEIVELDARKLYVMGKDFDKELTLREIYHLVKENNIVYLDYEYELCEYFDLTNKYFGFLYNGDRHNDEIEYRMIPKGRYFTYQFLRHHEEDISIYKERMLKEASDRGLKLSKTSIFLEYYYYMFYTNDRILGRLQYLIEE